MVHEKFDPNTLTLAEFDRVQQIGGGGEATYNYYHGTRPFMRGYGYYQTGAGVGDFLRTLWRAFLPSLKAAGKSIGTEALAASGRALEKIAEGGNVKEVFVKEAVKGADNLLEKHGMGRQFGSGKQRKKVIKRKSFVGKSVKFPVTTHDVVERKRKRSDAFGFY